MRRDMSKDLNDLTADEMAAYRNHLSKLKDLTLSQEEHERSRRAIDEIFMRGPNAKVLELQKRLERLEEAVFGPKSPAKSHNNLPEGVESASEPPKRRGRPRGSKNKPKEAVEAVVSDSSHTSSAPENADDLSF
jgi:hypothetical protein